MSHFGNTSGVKHTPSEWLAVGSQVGQLVNNWAERNDLVVYLGGDLKSGKTSIALFDPRLAEIEIHAKNAFGIADPKWVGDLNNRDEQYEFPKATGAILHEALHARFTLWDLEKASKELSESENKALHLLEESRIEALGVLTFPDNRDFLRASAMEIVLGELDEETLSKLSGTRAFAQVGALVGARIDAGVLDKRDVADVIALAVDNLGQELYDQLRAIWRKAQNYTAHKNPEPLYALAREWEQLVSEREKEKGEGEGEGGEPSEGEGEGMGKALAKAIAEAIAESADETSFRANDSLSQREQSEKWADEAKERNADGKRRQQGKVEQGKVFAKSTGEQGTNGSGSTLVETRKPTSAERVASVKVGQLLEKAKYRERDVTTVRSVLPAGRLRTRSLVQAKALESKGVFTPVEAWEAKTRKHTDEPTLTIGVMVDISGSMGMAMNPMATTAWVLANAGRRVQARTAMVYYGSGVFPTLRLGEKLDEVRVWSAPDGTEKFDQAFRALDSHLTLLDSQGAKMLVVVSDGQYTNEESKRARAWVQECEKKGVAVLWLTFDNYTNIIDPYLAGTNGQVVKLNADEIEKSAVLIGTAGAEVLSRIGRKNS
jgi:hypothetical protein